MQTIQGQGAANIRQARDFGIWGIAVGDLRASTSRAQPVMPEAFALNVSPQPKSLL